MGRSLVETADLRESAGRKFAKEYYEMCSNNPEKLHTLYTVREGSSPPPPPPSLDRTMATSHRPSTHARAMARAPMTASVGCDSNRCSKIVKLKNDSYSTTTTTERIYAAMRNM